MVRIPRLGQLPSEYGKFIANAGVMHRVTANLDLNVAYPAMVQPPQHMPGQSVNVFFVVLGRTLSEAAKFGLVAHVHLRVRSVLCLTGETNPTTSPLVQLICKAPALGDRLHTDRKQLLQPVLESTRSTTLRCASSE
ncbi:hypothetical protein MRX96_033836 [Rhipicephalus microplus]